MVGGNNLVSIRTAKEVLWQSPSEAELFAQKKISEGMNILSHRQTLVKGASASELG